MGNMNFGEMEDELSLHFGGRTDLESPTNWYQKWINKAYINLTTRSSFFGNPMRFFWPTLETSTPRTTSDGTAYVELPEDILIIRRVYNDTDDNKLNHISANEYYKKTDKADTNAEGTPTMYSRIGNYIYLYPTPDDSATVLTIYYRRIPEELSDSADVTVLGAEWDSLIVDLAKIYGHYDLQEYDLAKELKEHWKEDAVGLIDIYSQEEKSSGYNLEIDSQMKSGY